jgi:hypothetical protein
VDRTGLAGIPAKVVDSRWRLGDPPLCSLDQPVHSSPQSGNRQAPAASPGLYNRY